jgi:phosphotransferase system enzyme I (PtsI)
MKYDPKKAEITLQGIPISPGITVARVCLFNDSRHARIVPVKVDAEEKEREIARLSEAFTVAGERLAEIQQRVSREVGPAEGEIFVAQKMMVDDPTLRNRMLAAIREDDAGAEMAVMSVMDAYETRISALDNQYLRERSTDVGEVKRRLLDVLAKTRPGLECEGRGHCQRGRGRVVVGGELTPSMTIDLDARHLCGLVTEHGGVTSHAAILARALGVPAVSGIRGVQGFLTCGTEILVNGDTGEVIVWPSAERVALVPKRAALALDTEPVDPVVGLRVMANISTVADVTSAVSMKAEGVGLYRTEFEFMAAGQMLTEDEQFECYSAVVQAMKGAPVYIRLLDVGGDKRADYFSLPSEVNPALGLRGSRLLVKRPELLRDQARALARASVSGPIHVLYPMIVDVAQFVLLRNLFAEAIRDLPAGTLWHGVMFEVPSACLDAEELFKVADFGSIGTNDLYQYLFALDRDNAMVSWDFQPDRPVFWSLIRSVVKVAADSGKPLSVCGELAGMSEYAARLIDAGVTTVSVNPHLISQVRRSVVNRR